MERSRHSEGGIRKRTLKKTSHCLGRKGGREIIKLWRSRKGLRMRIREKSLRVHEMERRFYKTLHLLVLRFLHSLVDVIEDLSTAVCRLLHFFLLRCILWKILWHRIRSEASSFLRKGGLSGKLIFPLSINTPSFSKIMINQGGIMSS